MGMVEILTDEDLGNGCRLIKARGSLAEWTMERTGDDDPVFPSIPLALILGFSRARDLGKLIRRQYPTEVEFRATVARYSPTDGEVIFRRLQSGSRGQPEKEYLLTRRQTLKLIMRSETPKADALQNEMIDVVLTVMRERTVLGIESVLKAIEVEAADKALAEGIPDLQQLQRAVAAMAYSGESDLWLKVVRDRAMQMLSNRDCIGFVEKDLKTLLIANLWPSNIYRPLSEKEFAHGYADLFLALNPNYSDAHYAWMFELKVLRAGAKQSEIDEALRQAEKQLQRYLNDQLLLPSLLGHKEVKAAALVFVGFERYEVREVRQVVTPAPVAPTAATAKPAPSTPQRTMPAPAPPRTTQRATPAPAPAPLDGKYYSFDEARRMVQQHRFRNKDEYLAWWRRTRPAGLPSEVRRYYKDKGWTAWGDFLGSGYVQTGKRGFLAYETARDIVRNAARGFRSRADWEAWQQARVPRDIPAAPRQFYKEWVSWAEWLGPDRYTESTTRRPPTRTMTKAAQELLLKFTKDHRAGFRHHVMYSLAFGTSLREHEISALNVGDVSDDGASCKRRFAVRHETVTPPDGLRSKVRAFLAWKESRGESLDAEAPLFTNRDKRRVTAKAIRYDFHWWQVRAGIDPPYFFSEVVHGQT